MSTQFEQVPSDFLETIQINAGIICEGFVPDTGEASGILGATTGNLTFNPELNIDQNDLASQTQEIDAKAEAHVKAALADIHAHLKAQDAKLTAIMEEVKRLEADRKAIGADL